MVAYSHGALAQGARLSAITRHMLGLLTHTPGAREFRRLLAEGTRAPGAGVEVLERVRALVAGAGP